MRRWLLLFTAAGALAAPGWADDELDRLRADFQQAQMEYYAQITKMQEKDGAIDPLKLPPNPSDAFTPKFQAYAQKHSGKPEAIPALAWLIQNAADSDVARSAISRLADDHAGDSQIASVLEPMEYAGWSVGVEPIVTLCERIIEKNKSDDIRAAAMYTMGAALATQFAPDTKPDLKRAKALLDELVSKYPKSDAAERAKPFLYEFEHLQVGMKAPEIIGKTLDGKELRLSQFLGQVVVLDFWGFW
ncbi:MAG: hypothetical protein D6744_07640 [Planctomycetota bacterium]|nr:MAG: hypothetical protein D6744_07640 [Planctomycetota bacterium]